MALNPDDPNVQTVKVRPGQTVADVVGEDVATTIRKSFGGPDMSMTVTAGPAESGESDDCPHCGAENSMVENDGFGGATGRICIRCKKG